MARAKRNASAEKANQKGQAAAETPAAGDGFPGTNNSESAASTGAAGVPVAPRRGFIGDPYWGKGGRYIVGKDGVRRPAEQKE